MAGEAVAPAKASRSVRSVEVVAAEAVTSEPRGPLKVAQERQAMLVLRVLVADWRHYGTRV